MNKQNKLMLVERTIEHENENQGTNDVERTNDRRRFSFQERRANFYVEITTDFLSNNRQQVLVLAVEQ